MLHRPDAERPPEAYVQKADASAFLSASRAATWTARQGVGSHADAVWLVSECSMPVT
jgi:hypothetical protein